MTANKIPVPDPTAPRKSAKIVKAPTHIPPKVAAIGIYLLKTNFIFEFLNPLMECPLSTNPLTTSFTPEPDTSIQVLENKAQEMSTNAI